MLSHHDIVGVALDVLTQGLQPYVERELRAVHGDRWLDVIQSGVRGNKETTYGRGEAFRWDAYLVLIVMWDHWHNVFRSKLGVFERSLVSELREFRNQWAHQRQFSFDDTYRILDSIERLLLAVGAPQVAEIGRRKSELMRDYVQTATEQNLKRASQFRNNLWWVIGCVVCCVTLVVSSFINLGSNKGTITFSIAIVAAFAYIIIRRLYVPEQLGQVKECRRCGRVIYGDPCPYCRVPAVH